VLFFARHEAGRLGAEAIESDHLLYALLRDMNTVARRVLDQHGVDAQRLLHELEARGQGGRALPRSAEMSLSVAAERTLHLAVSEAHRLGHVHVGTAHILLALLHDADGRARILLNHQGVRPQDVADSVSQLAPETEALEPLGVPPTPGNWRRITNFVPSHQVHIAYSEATPEHVRWHNVAGVRWGAYGYTLRELVELAWDAPATVSPEGDATQRYDVELVLPSPEEDERLMARVRNAIQAQIGVDVEQAADGHVTARRRS
jgi:hypothetical protein